MNGAEVLSLGLFPVKRDVEEGDGEWEVEGGGGRTFPGSLIIIGEETVRVLSSWLTLVDEMGVEMEE